jgi:hypothetical protein
VVAVDLDAPSATDSIKEVQMLRILHGKWRYILLAFLLPATVGFFGPKLIPEMKEVVDNFTDRAKLAATLQKYSNPGVVPPELTLCDMAKPVVSKTEERDGVTYYTLESRVEKCEQHSEAAVGTVRIFAMGWKDGKIVKFAWGGPKSGNVEY